MLGFAYRCFEDYLGCRTTSRLPGVLKFQQRMPRLEHLMRNDRRTFQEDSAAVLSLFSGVPTCGLVAQHEVVRVLAQSELAIGVASKMFFSSKSAFSERASHCSSGIGSVGRANQTSIWPDDRSIMIWAANSVPRNRSSALPWRSIHFTRQDQTALDALRVQSSPCLQNFEERP